MLFDLLLGQETDPAKALTAMREQQLNFDPSRRAEYTAENGWHADDIRRASPRAARGAPTR